VTMTDPSDVLRIEIRIESDGQLRANRLDTCADLFENNVEMSGIDADLIRLFERWLGLRDRRWTDAEIRTFGSLLHRFLFGDRGWDPLYDAITQAQRATRLELIFPANDIGARLAAIPWEFLYRPDEANRLGKYLAVESNIVLSRYIPSDSGEPRAGARRPFRVLPVVSQPNDPRLGDVLYEDVLEAIRGAATALGWSLERELTKPTTTSLRQRVLADGVVDLVHFMGHGEFDPQRGVGSLALCDDRGETDWVPDRELARIMTANGKAPRAVVLHACDAGKTDFASFAGVASQLVRGGVPNVVAMQYPVTNETAIRFSTSLYRSIGAGADLDAAVQAARKEIFTAGRDLRLLGVPVVYSQRPEAFFTRGCDE
jgi:hypothetical protein